MTDASSRRLRPALPFTLLTATDRVTLVGGEDHRYTLTAPGVDRWLPDLLPRLDGRRTAEEAVAGLNAAAREAALRLLERLRGERVLVDGTAEDVHAARLCRVIPCGRGALRDRVAARPEGSPVAGDQLQVLCQDTLDYEEALAFGRSRRAERAPWLWATIGPLQRGFLGPLFVPEAGPCLACLLGHFRRRSPVPEIYDRLAAHARAGGERVPAVWPGPALDLLAALVHGKGSLLTRSDPPAALYRLHVLEVDTLEVTSHRVFADPECADCAAAGA